MSLKSPLFIFNGHDNKTVSVCVGGETPRKQRTELVPEYARILTDAELEALTLQNCSSFLLPGSAGFSSRTVLTCLSGTGFLFSEAASSACCLETVHLVCPKLI